MTTKETAVAALRPACILGIRAACGKRPGLRIALLACLGIAACGEPEQTTNTRPSVSAVRYASTLEIRRPPPAQAVVRSVGDDTSPAMRDFKSFALNTLLLPLLDDDLPSRWADPTSSLDCEDGRVTIDGRALDIGAPVPRDRFVVRWHLQHCETLDGYFELSGEVELRVQPRTGGFTAQVDLTGVQFASQHGVERIYGSFVADLDVGP